MGGIVSKLTGGGGSAPPAPAIPEPPAAPPDLSAAAAMADEQATKAKKGRAASILTGAKGAGTPNTAAKTLLGG